MSGHSDFETLTGPDRRRMPRPRGLSALIVMIALLIAVGMVLLWPRGESDVDVDALLFPDDTAMATVLIVEFGPCSSAPDFSCQVILFEVTEGPRTGEQWENEFGVGQPDVAPGDNVMLSVIEIDEETVIFQYADRDRRVLLGTLAMVFAIAVVGLGRMKGVAALAGLALSVAVLLLFILPAIVAGRDAVLVALVGGGAIALISLYLAHGYNPLTHAAALGAFSALVLTVALSWLAVTLARFTGLVSEDAFFLMEAIPGVDLSGLILAGIVLGSLGALDDVTVTQATAVWEVHFANPSLGPSELFSSGVRVGRNHIVSTVNTLLLAYAGAALPLLILYSLSNQTFGVVASSEVVATEIVRTLVGSMGLVAAVPITTWLAARLAGRTDLHSLGDGTDHRGTTGHAH